MELQEGVNFPEMLKQWRLESLILLVLQGVALSPSFIVNSRGNESILGYSQSQKAYPLNTTTHTVRWILLTNLATTVTGLCLD